MISWLRFFYWHLRIGLLGLSCHVTPYGEVTFNKPPKKGWIIAVATGANITRHAIEYGVIVPAIEFHVFVQGIEVRQTDV